MLVLTKTIPLDQQMAVLHEGLLNAPAVDTGHWQSLKNVPHTATRELQNVTMEVEIPGSLEETQWLVQPNLPWAEDHFRERVDGEPLNPGEQYKNWPWYRGGVEDHKSTGQFSHTYMERVWPRKAGDLDNIGDEQTWSSGSGLERMGIRYRLGDLNDVLTLLTREPHTRQAYLPIWFPEDTGAHHGERVPCSLGYHFMLRNGKLNVTYHMRSVDFLRYLRDDIYMAMRLGQWVLDSLVLLDIPEDQPTHEERPWPWDGVEMGLLWMTMASLHVFEGDMPKMRREAPGVSA